MQQGLWANGIRARLLAREGDVANWRFLQPPVPDAARSWIGHSATAGVLSSTSNAGWLRNCG